MVSLNRVMAEVDGFKDVHFSNNIPISALADWVTDESYEVHSGPATRRTDATCAVRSFGEPVHPGKASKLKKFRIELAGVAHKDVFVNYKSVKNMVLQEGKLCPVAVVGDDVDAYWSNDWGSGMQNERGRLLMRCVMAK